MINFSFCDLYKYYNAEKKNKTIDIKTPYLFVHKNNIDKLFELNLNLDANLKKLIIYLKNDQINFIFIFFDKQEVIHSSGVSLKKKSIDKFFFEFQTKDYGVIGPTFTNPSYRNKQFYKFALEMQINRLIEEYNIYEIFISTNRTKKTFSSFEHNNLKKFSLGLILSLLNKLFVYIIFKKPFRIRVFFNNRLLLRFR